MMKKVYFIYAIIPENIFNKVKYMLGNTERYKWKHDKMFGLYAWSTSKSIVKEFFEVRNKEVYTLIKKDIDEPEYEYIKDKYNLLKLDRRVYYLDSSKNIKKSVEIVSTKNEYVCTTIDSEEYLWEFGPPINESVPYHMFNDKIIYALDTIGYSKNYDLKFGDEYKSDTTSYNLSFGLTPMGQKDKIVYDNEMNILLFLFNYFFYGDRKEAKT